MASNQDHFIKALTAPPTRLSNAIGATSVNIGLESLEGIQSDTAIVMTIDRVDNEGRLTPELAEVVIGTLGNSGLENVVRGVGGKKQPHKTGAVAEVSIASSEQWNRVIKALLKTHNQDGTFRDNIVEGKHIRDNAVTEHKLANGAVTGSKIKDGAIEPKHLARPYPPIITLGRSDLANVAIGANYVTAAPIPWLAIDPNEHFELIDGSKLKLKTDCSKVKISLAVNTDVPEGNALQARFSVVDPSKPVGNQVVQTIVADTGKTGGMCSIVIPTACVDAKKGYYIEASLAGTFGGTYAIRPARSFLTCEIVN